MPQRFVFNAKPQSLSKHARFFDEISKVRLYSSQTVRNECESPGQLLGLLALKDLKQTVPEAAKLLELVLTILTTRASVERSLSALKRLKTYSQNRTDQGRLSSLAIVSIETERLLKIKKTSTVKSRRILSRRMGEWTFTSKGKTMCTLQCIIYFYLY